MGTLAAKQSDMAAPLWTLRPEEPFLWPGSGGPVQTKGICSEASSEEGRKQVQELCRCPHAKKLVFVERNLYVALRDEILPDVMALNRALEPHEGGGSSLTKGRILFQSEGAEVYFKTMELRRLLAH
jgi:hypothetical protein